LELALSQEVYEYLEELDEMNWSARGNVLNQYLRNTSIGTTVIAFLYETFSSTAASNAFIGSKSAFSYLLCALSYRGSFFSCFIHKRRSI
jgi:hypothetical protein